MEVTGGSLDFRATIDYSQLVSAVKKIESRLSGIEDVANGAGNAIDGIGSKLAGLVSTAGIAAFAKKIFDVRSSFEDAEAAMNVFTKDVDVAKKHLAELQDYAWYNMFEFDQLVDASKQLQAFGTNVDDVIPVIDKLSNVAAATGGELGRFVQLYNKSKARGVLDSETLASFASQGFVVKNELKLMGEAVDGNTISFEQFSKALDHATSEGGMFAGLMNEQFNNLSSLWGAVQDSWTSMLNEIGQGTQGVMKDALKLTNNIISNWRDVADVLVYVVAAYGTYRAALMATAMIQKAEASGLITNIRLIGMYRKELGLATAAQQAFGKAKYAKMMTNVYAALAAAVAIATVAIVKHIRKQNELERELRKVDTEFNEQREAINADLTILGKLEKGTDEYNEKLKDMTANYPHYIKYLKDENGALLDAAEARERINEAMEKELLLRKYQKAIEITEQNVDERSEKVSEGITSVLKKQNVKIDGIESNEVEMSWISDIVIDEMKKGFEEGTYAALGEYGKGGKLSKAAQNSFDRLRSSLFGIFEEKGVSSDNLDFMVSNIIGKLSDNKFLDYLKEMKSLNESAGAVESERREQEKKEQQAEIERQRQEQAANKKSLASIRKEYNDRKKERDKIMADIRKNGYTEDVTDEKGNVIVKGSKTQLEELNKEMSSLDEKYESLSGKKLSKSLEESKKNADETTKAIRALDEAIKELFEHEEDLAFDNRERSANLKEGFEKEQELRKINHEKTMKDIERWVEEEKKRYEEIDKMEWLAYNPNKSEEDFYRQYRGLSDGVNAKIARQAEQQRNDEDARYLKEQQDVLNEMLSKYGEYTESKRRIDSEYQQELDYLNGELAKATTEQQKQQIKESIDSLKTEWAKQQFDLDMGVVDASHYATVEDRMDAINAAYDSYIKNLDKAGASHEMIEAVIAEQVETTGKLARLEAERADIEARIRNLQQGGTDKEGLSLSDLLERLSKVNKELDRAQGGTFSQLCDENKNRLVSMSIDQVTESLQRLAEATGSLNAEQAAEFMTSLSKGLQGFQQGGFIGLLFAGIEDTLSQLADDIVSAEALASAIDGGRLEKWRQDMHSLMEQGQGGIFGDDEIAGINGSIQVLEEARKKMEEFGVTVQGFNTVDFNSILGMTNLLNWKNWAGAFGAETREDVKAYFDAIEKGYSELEAHVLRADDRGWLANLFGVNDKYENLRDMVEGLGYDLYDEYGNLNSDALQALLDTYDDLSQADRDWITEAIAYSDEYKEAMENIASYLNDLFGGVAESIADRMVEAFIATGDAAVDLGEVVADVGKNMAKDLVKSLIISTYFEGMEDDFKNMIAKNGMTADTAGYIIGRMNEAMVQLGNDTAYWNNVMANLSGLWEGYEGVGESVGTALSSASQESIDLMSGQLNAMRTVQSRIDGKIDSILLELQGFHKDANSRLDANNEKLDQIISNTSEQGSLVRGIGAYL